MRFLEAVQNSRYGLKPVEGRHLSLCAALLGFKRSDVWRSIRPLCHSRTRLSKDKRVWATLNRLAHVVTELFSTSHKTKPVANTTERNQCGVNCVFRRDLLFQQMVYDLGLPNWFFFLPPKHRFPPFLSPNATKVESVMSIELGSSADCDWSRTKA